MLVQATIRSFYLFVWKTIVINVCILFYKTAVALLWISIKMQVGPINIFQVHHKFIHLGRALIAYKVRFTTRFHEFITELEELGQLNREDRKMFRDVRE